MFTYKQTALDLAHKAGKIMKTNFSLGMKKAWKEDNTPLTVTDTAINELVISTIKKRFPEHSIAAEEGSHIVEKSEYAWVCDPVDGTVPFSHGIPTFTFSLALTRNGESILGLALDPIMERLFFAEKGRGAYINGAKLQVSKQAKIPNALIYGIWFNGAAIDISRLQHDIPQSGGNYININSSVYAGTMVAAGEFAGAVHSGDKPWDAAAVKIIVEEAGGKVTDLFGNDQRYDMPTKGFLASNGYVHNKLLTFLSVQPKETKV